MAVGEHETFMSKKEAAEALGIGFAKIIRLKFRAMDRTLEQSIMAVTDNAPGDRPWVVGLTRASVEADLEWQRTASRWSRFKRVLFRYLMYLPPLP
jgi:hypothetical protein